MAAAQWIEGREGLAILTIEEADELAQTLLALWSALVGNAIAQKAVPEAPAEEEVTPREGRKKTTTPSSCA